jgi:hypothetical protein
MFALLFAVIDRRFNGEVPFTHAISRDLWPAGSECTQRLMITCGSKAAARARFE